MEHESRWQGHGANVTITELTLVIERTGQQAQKRGPRQTVSLKYLVGFHVKAPSTLSHGWIQLCIGVVDPAHGRDAAAFDPHTVMFTRGQRVQMASLTHRLQQIVDVNNGGGPRAVPVPPSAAPATRSQQNTPVDRTGPATTPPQVTAAAPSRPEVTAAPPSRPEVTAAPPSRPEVTASRPDLPAVEDPAPVAEPAPADRGPVEGDVAAPAEESAEAAITSEPGGAAAPADTTGPSGTTGPSSTTGPRHLTRTTGPARPPVLPKPVPPEPNPDADPDHPLHGHTVVVIGILSGLERVEAWTQLAACGARVHDNITRATTVLVAGTWVDEKGRPEDTRSLATARRLHDAGHRITIIDEQQMAALLAGDRSPGLPDPAAPAVIDPFALADDSGIAPWHRADPLQQVRGRHYCAWGEPIRQLVDDDRLDEALELLLEVIAVAELPENCGGGAPVPGWTEQAADVYRRLQDHVGEVTVLQRWFEAARRNGYPVDESHPLVAHIATARTLMEDSFRR